MVGTDQPLRAAAIALHQLGAAVPADIGEGANDAVLAADHQHALAQKFERLPLARLGHVADMADNLPRRAQHARHLQGVIFGIVIEPARQAPALVGILGDERKRGGGHGPVIQASAGAGKSRKATFQR
jgi:hypothetical protein